MLQELTLEFIYHFMLIFARLGAAFMTFPALGDRYIFIRSRLVLALIVSLGLQPLISQYLPKYLEDFSANVSFIAIEILVGIIISIGAKLYFSSLHVVGQIISMQSGLGSATFFDPAQRSQVALFSSFLFLTTTLFILVTDTHYLFIQSVIDSYSKFPPGELLDSGQISKFIAYLVNDSFILAFKVSSPFLIVGLIVLISGGVLSRLMPNLQVFFVITPAQILMIFVVFYITVNSLVAKIVDSIASTTNISNF